MTRSPDRIGTTTPDRGEARCSHADDLAREPLPERERAAVVLLSAVHLTDDVHGLADFVVQSEEEDRCVHHARRLVVERAEELYKITRIRSDRSKSTRELESSTELFIIGGRRLQHVPHAPT